MTLRDRLKAFFSRDSKPPRAAPTKTVGTRGVRVYRGRADDSETNASLIGTERHRTFTDTILNVSIVASCVRYGVDIGGSSSWGMEPAKDGGREAQDAADWAWEVLTSMRTPFEDVVARDVLHKYVGASVQEWTAERGEDGRLWLRDVAPRAMSLIEEFGVEDDTGDVTWFGQRNPRTFKMLYIPRWKCTYIVDDLLPGAGVRGVGLLRHAVADAKRIQRYEQLEGWGYETDMRGVPIGWAPLAALKQAVKDHDITQAEMDEMLRDLETVLENHVTTPDQGIMLDSEPYAARDDAERPSGLRQWGFEVIKGGSTGFSDLDVAIRRKAHDCARIMGCEHLLLGSGPNGTRSLDESKSRNFSLVMDRTLGSIGRGYDRDLIGPLWTLNALDERVKPRLVPEATQFISALELADAVRSMVVAGAQLDNADEATREVFRFLGLTPPEPRDPDPIDVDGGPPTDGGDPKDGDDPEGGDGTEMEE